MTSLEKLLEAEKGLSKRPPDYFGIINDWIDEGFSDAIFGHHRDSDILEESNWKSICEIFDKWIDGDEGAVRIATSNHWAVGWVESMHIKIRNKNGKFTKPFRLAIDVLERLDNYPVLDEEQFSQMEYDDLYEYIEREVGSDKAGDCIIYLTETYHVCSSDDVHYEWIEEWKESSVNA